MAPCQRGSVRAGDDADGGVAAPAAGLLVEECGDGDGSVGLGDGECFEHAAEVLGAAVGFDDFEFFAEHHESDAAALVDEEACDGGGGGDGGFDAGVVALAGVLLAGEVEDDPHVGGWVEFEGFDFEVAAAEGAGPVDAVDAVAGFVVADAGGVWGDVVGASAEAAFAGEVGGGGGVAGEVDGAGVDDEGAAVAEAEFAVEDAEGVAAADGDGAEFVDAAAGAGGLQAPGAAAVGAEGGDEFGAVAGQGGAFFEFEPEFGEAGGAFDFEALDDGFAGLDAVAAAGHADVEALSGGPGPEAGDGDAEEEGVAEAEGSQ